MPSINLGHVVGPQGLQGPRGLSASANILDNSWFVNPVNQRGITENSENGNSYFIDRWFIYKGTAKVTNIGIQVIADKDTASFLCQYIKGLRDGTYTLAAKVNGNTVLRVIQISGTTATTIDGNKAGYTGGYLVFMYANDDKFEFDFRVESGATITVEWAALYEGSYTADTIPSYVPKGYAAELAECQRYYQTIPALTHIPGVTNTSVSFSAKYKIPTMRIAPTVSIASGQEVSIYTGEYSASTTNYTMQYATMPNQMILNLSLGAGSFVAYKPGMLIFPVEIALSADL